MMEEIINLVVEKTGISETQAQVAVTTVLDFIKNKLPVPLAYQVDSLVENAENVAADGVMKMVGGLGGLFGKK